LKELSLHILDIAENSVSAGATKIEIIVKEDLNNDLLEISIKDNGMGMDAEFLKRITDPFVTSRTTRKVGLGIPFLKAAAEACGGRFIIESLPGSGTFISASFQHSHLDRMPLGDLKGTILNLIVGYPDIQWIFRYENDGTIYYLDTKPMKEILGDVPFSDPAVIRYLNKYLENGLYRKNGHLKIKYEEKS